MEQPEIDNWIVRLGEARLDDLRAGYRADIEAGRAIAFVLQTEHRRLGFNPSAPKSWVSLCEDIMGAAMDGRNVDPEIYGMAYLLRGVG